MLDKVGFKDLGAGGVACASVELAETSGYGSEVWLDNVHTSMENLHSSVYLCSETQERFMWVCPPDLTGQILDHYNNIYDLPSVSEGAMASVIGKIRDDGKYIVHYKNEVIVDAEAKQVTKGFLYDRNYSPVSKETDDPKIVNINDFEQVCLQLLSHENIASKKVIYDKYDKQVQGRTVFESGEADCGLLAPFNSDEFPNEIRKTGIALSTDHNPLYGKVDPYWAGVNAVVESMRNVASIGATPHALTDCLCFGNPEKESQMWEFVESVKGISDACKSLTLKHSPNDPTPIIAGNVSFYNESRNGAIPPSPIVSCLGKIDDINNAIGMSFISPNSTIILIGKRKNELGGSAYYHLFNELGNSIPKPDLSEVKNQIFALTDCIGSGLVLSCHDISDGGIAVALAEMSFRNGLGCDVKIESDLEDGAVLFSETGGFILEIRNEDFGNVESCFQKYGLECFNIGSTIEGEIKINNAISLSTQQAFQAWSDGLSSKL